MYSSGYTILAFPLYATPPGALLHLQSCNSLLQVLLLSPNMEKCNIYIAQAIQYWHMQTQTAVQGSFSTCSIMYIACLLFILSNTWDLVQNIICTLILVYARLFMSADSPCFQYGWGRSQCHVWPRCRYEGDPWVSIVFLPWTMTRTWLVAAPIHVSYMATAS